MIKKETDDEAILAYIADPQQRERGFRLLLEGYQERLYWQIRQMVFSHEDASDVLQNCLLKIFRGLPNFKGDAQLYTWMYRIAANESISFLKKEQKRSFALVNEEDAQTVNLQADDFFDGEAARKKLREAMKTLPPKQLEVFTLRYFQEMPYQEMAELLGTSVGGLKASFHQAVKKIETYIVATN